MTLGIVPKNPAAQAVDAELSAREADVRDTPDHVAARMRLGAAFHSRGRPADALPHFEAAMRLAPEDASPVAAAAAVLGELALPGAAWSITEPRRALFVATAEGATNFAVIAESAGHVDEARAAYAHALSLAPSHARALGNLALLRSRANEHDGAVALAAALQRGAPRDLAAALIHIDVLRSASREAEAAQVAAHAVPTFGPHPALLVREAVSRAAEGEFAAAGQALAPLGARGAEIVAEFLSHGLSPVRRRPPPDLASVFLARVARDLQTGDDRLAPRLAAWSREQLDRPDTLPARDWADLLALAPVANLSPADIALLREITGAVLRAQALQFAPAVLPDARAASGVPRVGLLLPSGRGAERLHALAAHLRLHGDARLRFFVYLDALPAPDTGEAADLLELQSLAPVVELAWLTAGEATARLRLDRLDVAIDFTARTTESLEAILHARVAALQVLDAPRTEDAFAPYDRVEPDFLARGTDELVQTALTARERLAHAPVARH